MSDHRLAVYGTLAPGEPNHHVVADLAGRWLPGTVRGRLVHEGWAADHGYPALVLDLAAAELPVQILESEALRTAWPRLDAFEGPGYRRVVTTVHAADGDVTANIYVAA